MYNVYLRRKRCILPDKQWVQREEHSFCLFQNTCKLPISISSFFQYYIICCSNQYFQKPKFQKTKTDAPIVINLFFKKYLSRSPNYFHQYLINFIRIFAPLSCCHILWSCFRDTCFYLLVFAFTVVFSFHFHFHFWPKFCLQQ